MKLKFDSKNIIQEIESKGVIVLRATPINEDIGFDNDSYTDFFRLLEELEIKIVFIEIVVLEEYEIDDSVINSRLVNLFDVEVLNFEIDSFNNRVESLREFVGAEQSIKLFFSHYGTVYSCTLHNNDLYPDDKADFIDELIEKYHEEIEKKRTESYSEHRKILDSKFERLRNYLIRSEDFKICTNKELRKAFVFKKLRQDEEINDINKTSSIPVNVIMDVVEETWRDLKLKKHFIL